jgi:hypothetical protein
MSDSVSSTFVYVFTEKLKDFSAAGFSTPSLKRKSYRGRKESLFEASKSIPHRLEENNGKLE